MLAIHQALSSSDFSKENALQFLRDTMVKTLAVIEKATKQ
jgi:hypothetical protein